MFYRLFSKISSVFLLVVHAELTLAQSITVEEGKWLIKADNITGGVELDYDGKCILGNNVPKWGLDSCFRSMADCHDIKVGQQRLNDIFGNGVMVTVSGINGEEKIEQNYYLYGDRNYVMTDLTVSSASDLELNYMAPVESTKSVKIFEEPDNNILFVPYDNDAWVRYKVTSFGEKAPVSHEVSSVWNRLTRESIVVGSVEHDVWKTGIEILSKREGEIDTLCVHSGYTDELSRDVMSHGVVKGKRVKSPKIMIGKFDDWRDGLETFADVCRWVSPRLSSLGEKPFGWNSWGKIQTDINLRNALEVSEYFKDELQPQSFADSDGVVCIGLDSFWNVRMNEPQLIKFADTCHSQHQKAGIYYCPFTDWIKDKEAVVEEMPEYKYKDIYLYHNGKILEFDGAYALDPTHPATMKRIEKRMRQFIDWGYDFVKLDFMGHGAYEADSHFDSEVTTGIQAYNKGMAYIDSLAADKLWLNLSIAPLFPANYAHSRRIGCDAWASMENTEYTLNALSYGWWLDRIYHYNDADHIVMEGVSEGENRARLTSSAITGLYFLGDDLSESGSEAVKARVKKYATNPDINEMARRCKSFRPVENGLGEASADMFYYIIDDDMYVALFNFTPQLINKKIDMGRLGLNENNEYPADELWQHLAFVLSRDCQIELPPKDARILRIKLK